MRRSEADSSSMLASVLMRGCVPVWMAAFSAGSPKESKPIGERTPSPRMVR